jgi:hypothetical protein
MLYSNRNELDTIFRPMPQTSYQGPATWSYHPQIITALMRLHSLIMKQSENKRAREGSGDDMLIGRNLTVHRNQNLPVP